MSISRIMELMPVPAKPVEVDGHDWPLISNQLGVNDLPSDYKVFVSTYGTGSIGDFLSIMNPISNNRCLNVELATHARWAYLTLKSSYPQYYLNDAKDFLPWGITDNGDYLVWNISDTDPEKWLVKILASDPAEEEATVFNTSGFLVSLLERKLVSTVFPSEFLAADKDFTPFDSKPFKGTLQTKAKE